MKTPLFPTKIHHVIIFSWNLPLGKKNKNLRVQKEWKRMLQPDNYTAGISEV